MAIGLISAVVRATALRRAVGSSAAALPHSGTGPPSAPEQARMVHSIPRAWIREDLQHQLGALPITSDPPRDSDIVSLGESAVGGAMRAAAMPTRARKCSALSS
jgi:hypothetical protein